VETEFLGGAMRLDTARAAEAIAPIARRLGGSLAAAADGIVRVATATMERAIRVITVERGHDPRKFTLVAFGGAGGLHATALADALGMRRVYVPPHPGVLSAAGAMAAAVVLDFVDTLRAAEPHDAELARRLRGLSRAAVAAAEREDVRRPHVERSLDVRYVGQSYDVNVPWTRGWRTEFHRRHARLFGHADARHPLEVVALRVRARSRHAPTSTTAARPVRRGAAPVGRRRVFFETSHTASVHRRAELAPGRRLTGPAIVCEYSATTVVPPRWGARVDATGGLLLERR